MMRWIVLSLIFHLGLLAVAWRQIPRSRFEKPTLVYQVALVSLPKSAAVPEPEKTDTEIPAPEKPKALSLKVPEKTPKPPVPAKSAPKSSGPDTVRTAAEPQIRVDGEPFSFSYYLETLRKRIQENWHPPIQSGEGSNRRSAVVAFTIRRTGQIEHIELEKPAGEFLYDQAARRAVFNVGRLPPLPSEFEGESLNVHVEFEAL
jgi:TonB family protein